MDNMYKPAAGGGYPAGIPDPVPAPPRGKRWFRWGAGATLFGLLAGGGITLTVVSGGGTVSASTGTASPASGAQAAQLNTALIDAGVPPARVRWALGRIRQLGGVEGNVTFRGKTGFHTISFERGTIQSVNGSDVVLKSPDGTTWTWHIVGSTVIRKDGSKATASALSAGETAFAGGPLAGGVRDARLIIVRPAGSGSPESQSAQTSLS